MSYCTLLITKKSQTVKIQEEIKKFSNRIFPFGSDIITEYISKQDLRNIPSILSHFEDFDFILLEDYYSTFVDYLTHDEYSRDQKIKQFQKKGWSEEKIQQWADEQQRKSDTKNTSNANKKMREEFIFKLSENYFLGFVYYMQSKKWNGFKNIKNITSSQEQYEENTVYAIDEKLYKKVLNAISYSL